ncbi:hypothetical protein JTB14_009153 [Gonioctena quinquepunctata]|nr:hypothetical protein JTB14_009153 [Gonioctena quinquepunctata]
METTEKVMTCCMVGCTNLSTDDNKVFFGFPTDFNLCMLWVQNCGKPELFEDFAFGGAEPFLTRHICSEHFVDTNFINPEDKALGLLPESIPQLNICQVSIKEERYDPEYATALDILTETVLLPEVKLEVTENDNCDDADANFSMSSNEDSSYDTYMSKDPLSESDAEEIKLSDNFFRDYNSAMRNSRRENESGESQEKKGKTRKRSHRKRCRSRLTKEALRARIRRSNETEEQTIIRRMKNALRAAFRRRNETPEQREARRVKDMIRAQNRRRAETEAEARIRRYNDAVRAAYRRNNETEEERNARRMKDSMRAKKRRSMETAEQRETRLRKDRERMSKKRMLKKIFDQMNLLNEANDITFPEPVTVKDETLGLDMVASHFIDSTPITMSSLSSIVRKCNESSDMERLREVLQFIKKNVRGLPESNEKSLSSDDQDPLSMQEAPEEKTDDGMSSCLPEDLQYQQNILNFLSWSKVTSHLVADESIPNATVSKESICDDTVNEGQHSTKEGQSTKS